MNATGKKNRKQNGMNRYEIHKATHSHKSDEKRRKMNWGKSGAGHHTK